MSEQSKNYFVKNYFVKNLIPFISERMERIAPFILKALNAISSLGQKIKNMPLGQILGFTNILGVIGLPVFIIIFIWTCINRGPLEFLDSKLSMMFFVFMIVQKILLAVSILIICLTQFNDMIVNEDNKEDTLSNLGKAILKVSTYFIYVIGNIITLGFIIFFFLYSCRIHTSTDIDIFDNLSLITSVIYALLVCLIVLLGLKKDTHTDDTNNALKICRLTILFVTLYIFFGKLETAISKNIGESMIYLLNFFTDNKLLNGEKAGCGIINDECDSFSKILKIAGNVIYLIILIIIVFIQSPWGILCNNILSMFCNLINKNIIEPLHKLFKNYKDYRKK